MKPHLAHILPISTSYGIFNMGASASTAGIKISNVSLKKTTEIEITEGEKEVLADGNYVYNGSFQEGEGRLGYWTIQGNQGSEVKVTNENNIRRLMAKAPEGTSAENPIIIFQEKLAFYIKAPGVFFIDDVRIEEDLLRAMQMPLMSWTA